MCTPHGLRPLPTSILRDRLGYSTLTERATLGRVRESACQRCRVHSRCASSSRSPWRKLRVAEPYRPTLSRKVQGQSGSLVQWPGNADDARDDVGSAEGPRESAETPSRDDSQVAAPVHGNDETAVRSGPSGRARSGSWAGDAGVTPTDGP